MAVADRQMFGESVSKKDKEITFIFSQDTNIQNSGH